MLKYNSNNIKSLSKKEELKLYNNLTLNNFINLGELNNHYDNDFISPTGKTINDYKDLIKRFSNCSSSLTYEIEDSTEEITKYKLIDGNPCKMRCACSVCSSIKRNQIIQSILPEVKTLSLIEDINFYMITLTIENNDDAGIAYSNIRDAWTKFQKKGQKRKDKKSSGEFSKIIGSVFSMETSKGKDNKKHVHAHVLAVTDQKINYKIYDYKGKKGKKLIKKYGYGKIPIEELKKIAIETINFNGENVPISKLSKEWYQSTNQKAINIDCSPIISNKKNSIADQVFEVIKYEVKSWEFKGKDILDIYDSLSGKRQITKSGIFTKRTNSVLLLNTILEKNKLTDYYRSLKETIEKQPFVQSSIVSFLLNNESKKYEHAIDKNYDDNNIDYIRKVRAFLLNDYRRSLKDLINLLTRKDVCVINKIWINKKQQIKDAFRWSCNLLFEVTNKTTRSKINCPLKENIDCFRKTIDRFLCFNQLDECFYLTG